MTRDELFERYVADTLDEEALAELARLREEDVEFAAQFDADLVATGKFRDAEGGVERIEKGNEGGTSKSAIAERFFQNRRIRFVQICSLFFSTRYVYTY